MTDRYVGPGGSDGASGLSWALRKETLNGVEDTPVVAGDTVYVGPGIYRETLACDVSGSSGNEIEYIGDVTGINTDGVGGLVRITGSDDDYAVTRSYAINLTGNRDYRTFRGFTFDLCGNEQILGASSDNLIIEDCTFHFSVTSGASSENIAIIPDATGHTVTIRRCFFYANGWAIFISGNFSTNIRIENCIFYRNAYAANEALEIVSAWNVYIVNCTFITTISSGGGSYGEGQTLAINSNGVNYMYNCVIAGGSQNIGVGDLTSDFNVWGRIYLDRSANISLGGDSYEYPVFFNPPTLIKGMVFPWMLGELAPHSPVIGLACNNEAPTDDFFGVARPSADAKKTRGAIQNVHAEKSTTQIEGTWPHSMLLPDAMAKQFIVPITGKQMTVSAEVYRESSYAGTLPQLIIKQPGQSTRTNTDVGAVSQWNTLSDTFTPASSPPYIVVEIRSDNTASAGSYGAYFSSMRAD